MLRIFAGSDDNKQSVLGEAGRVVVIMMRMVMDFGGDQWQRLIGWAEARPSSLPKKKKERKGKKPPLYVYRLAYLQIE